MIIPPYLQPGDTMAIVCPSGFMAYEKAQICIDTLLQWGFEVKIGKTLGKQFHYFSGTDDERLNDFQSMLDDISVKAILCGRGGYGLSRIIDSIDFTNFIQNPKWVIGYSDITLLHSHILSQLNIASVHSPMAAAFNNGGAANEFVKSLESALKGEHYIYTCTTHDLNRMGTARGELIGGNLSMLVHTIGTNSEIDTKYKILFLEDIGEYLYSIDRMMMHLKRAGKLENLSGLVIGSFTEMKDTKIPFGQHVYEIISDKVKEYSYPVCFGFPVGHTDKNYALKVGVEHRLDVSRSGVILKDLSE